MFRALVAVVALMPTLALAQQAQKFDAKKLGQEFPRLPVFQAKKAVAGNEVLFQTSDENVSAIYVVKAELKQVVAFYQQKVGAPEKKGDDALGTTRYTFEVKARKGDKYVVAAMLEEAGPKLVQITLSRRPIAPGDIVDDGEEDDTGAE